MGYNISVAYTRQLYKKLYARKAESVEVPQFSQIKFDALLNMHGKVEDTDYTKTRVLLVPSARICAKNIQHYCYRRII
jgi:hypothetical protein